MSAENEPKKFPYQEGRLGKCTIIHNPPPDHPIFRQRLIVGSSPGFIHAMLLAKLHKEASAEGKADNTVRFAEVRLFAFLFHRRIGCSRAEVCACGLDRWQRWNEVEAQLTEPADREEFRRLLDDVRQKLADFRARSACPASAEAQGVTPPAEPGNSTPGEVNPTQPV